ncbi:MAG: ROK family protein [Nitrospirae bacterium]|nr:ROK family protein [Nitrospirota bacterium]
MKKIQEEVVIGIDLGGSAIRLSTVTKRGRIINPRRIGIAGRRYKDHILTSIIYNVLDIKSLENTRRNKVVAVGIGSPGIIDFSKGTIISSPNFPDWKDVPLRSLLERSLDLPVTLENDANAAAFGEKWKGAGRGVNSLICMTMGTGIGGGIILNGNIWHGAHGMGGEVGHMTVNPEGPLCNCGNNGCLEAYSSATGMVRSAVESINGGKRTILIKLSGGDNNKITAKMIHEAALQGDSVSINILTEAGKYLGIAIASLMHILNPEMIVLTGAVTGAWDFFMPAAKKEVEKRAYKAMVEKTKIVPGMLIDSAGIVGAAGLAMKQLGLLKL